MCYNTHARTIACANLLTFLQFVHGCAHNVSVGVCALRMCAHISAVRRLCVYMLCV